MNVSPTRADTRSAIVEATARLLREHGPAAVTTRGVAESAGVQAPTIYRLFGDKDGLIEAVAEHVLDTHVTAKATKVRAESRQDTDPVEDLRAGWRSQVEFGLANPFLFMLLVDPARAASSTAALAGRRVLAARVHRIARAGRLRVREDRAVDLVHAAGTGAILALLAVPPATRDPGLPATMLDAVLNAVLIDAPPPRGDTAASRAVALRAVTSDLSVLSVAERGLLDEWLDRVSQSG